LQKFALGRFILDRAGHSLANAVIPLKDYNPTRRRAYVTFALILINVGVYFFVQPHGSTTADPRSVQVREAVFTYGHAAVPCEVVHGHPLDPTQIETGQCVDNPAEQPAFPHKNVYLAIIYSMFLHGSLLHIGGNMLFLWIFGNNIEDVLGPFKYVLFYLVAGIVAAFAHIAVQPNSTVPIVGASGAIAGVMGAYMVIFPNVRIKTLLILIFFVFIRDFPAKWLLGFWFILQFFTAPGSGVAWVAHVGGFVFGLLVGLLLRDRAKPVAMRADYLPY
jgi:membrane associated rhomboid family serine protease